jgi:hypothetical protein
LIAVLLEHRHDRSLDLRGATGFGEDHRLKADRRRLSSELQPAAKMVARRRSILTSGANIHRVLQAIAPKRVKFLVSTASANNRRIPV